MLELMQTKRTDPYLLDRMKVHYSQPRGFVGRNICYALMFDGTYHGHIVAGSATRFLPGRNEFLGIDIDGLNHVINNIFFSAIRVNNKYPTRNFTSLCVKRFREISALDWKDKYGDEVVGFETLIEKPRSGELYKRDGWILVGETRGFTCKRVSGHGTDNWSGKRIWNTNKDQLRPKLVFCYKL